MISLRRSQNRLLFHISKRFASTSSSEEFTGEVKHIIDPYKNQYTDFLNHIGAWEEANQDTLQAMYVLDEHKRLPGCANQEGT